MALGIVHDRQAERAAYYDTVTGVAFGEVWEGIDAEEQARHFALWLSRRPGRAATGEDDPRALSARELANERRFWAQEYINLESGLLCDKAFEELANE
jgi:hypothetical protein